MRAAAIAGRVWALVVKEFLALLRDRKSRMVVIVPPLIQTLVFAYAATFDVRAVPLGLWVEDGGGRASALLQRFADSAAFAPAGSFARPEEVAAAITEQRVLAVLHIGQTFSADLAAGRPAEVQLLIDGRRSNTALIVQGYAASIVAAFNQEEAGRPGGGGAEVALRAWYNPTLESRWFILPGLTAVLSMIVAMLVTSLSVARERELGTFEQLLVTPLRPAEILVGKILPGLAVGLLEANLIALVAVAWFGVPFVGSLALLELSLALFLLSGVALGLAISAVAQTQQQAILGVFLFLAPAVTLSGFATPIANMPGWAQLLTRINPIRYMMVLARGLFLQDMPWSVAWPQLWPMTLIGIAAMAAATWLFRRRLG
ncbi:MAG: ABC transporter permease [Dongiaceae bacterium]